MKENKCLNIFYVSNKNRCNIKIANVLNEYLKLIKTYHQFCVLNFLKLCLC